MGAWEAGAMRDAGQLGAAIDRWHRTARSMFTSLTAAPSPRFRPRFRWGPAAGQPVRQPTGASVAWRGRSAREFDAAAIVARLVPEAADSLVLARHWSKICALQRVASTPGETRDTAQAWAAAFRRAQLSQGHHALRSLAASAARRASKIEESVARARMARIDARGRAAVAPLSEQAALDREAAGWAANRVVEGAYRKPAFPQHLLPAPEPIALWGLDLAVVSFPICTPLGADSVAPRAILRLLEAACLMLIQILLAAERLGRWSDACNLFFIVLLPKPDGGLRPIGLFPTLVRVWMRARATVALAWEAARTLPAVFGSAGRGSQRAAGAASFAAEAAAVSLQQHVAFLVDLVKAIERIPRYLIAAAAARWDFNLAVLRLSLAAHRRSSLAAMELQLLLHESMLIASIRWPMLRLYLYVDDLTVTASGSSPDAVDAVPRSTDFCVDMFETCLKLTASPTKSFAAASTPRLAVRLSRSMRRQILAPKRSVKLLGTPFSGGWRRSVGVLMARLKAFQQRILRMHVLRRQRIDVTCFVGAMACPSMVYGVDIVGASNTHLHRVRVAALSAALPPGAHCNVDVGYAVLDSGGSVLDPAYAAHATPLRHWGLAYWQDWAPSSELERVFGLARRRLQGVVAQGRSPWSAVTGPVAGVIATAWCLGWSRESPRCFYDDNGEPV
ncbi:unnamed protein product, partial [Prorocentrum cordatum]